MNIKSSCQEVAIIIMVIIIITIIILKIDILEEFVHTTLTKGISEENINFRDLSNVNVTSENGELKLPFPTHTHLPFPQQKPFLQAANLVEGTLERSAKPY